MTFDSTLEKEFPGALTGYEFVAHTHRLLCEQGFGSHNTIACVGTCRDELCVPLRRAMQDVWGEAFNFSSLAGMLLLGKAGFGAAHAHAPVDGDRERYLYLAMPHIGIGRDGTIGIARRIGREGDSLMCGALSVIAGELQNGPLDPTEDPDNPELSLLRRKLAAHLGDERPAILELTRAMQKLIERDLQHMIELTVDTGMADYAVLTGIQIHGPHFSTYVHPGLAYACVGGECRDLKL